MRIYTLSLMVMSCIGCQSPSASNGAGKVKSDTVKNSLDQAKSSDSSSVFSKRDTGFSRDLKFGAISFHVYSPNKVLHNSIIIQPSGLKDNSFVQTGVNGNVNAAFIGDLNKDGFPEIYYLAKLETGETNLFGYGSNKNKNLRPVYMPDIKQNQKWGTGYRGGDEYKLVGDFLVRSFPVFAPSDPAHSPSGGKRDVHYHLVPAVNGWIMKIVEVGHND